MKVAPRLPESLRIIDCEVFLAALEKRGQMHLRMRTETPGLHLLALFTDSAERYAVLLDVGPQAKYTDLRRAMDNGPAALKLAYIIPCAQCPPYAIPANTPRCSLPTTLVALEPPPENFVDAPAGTGEGSPGSRSPFPSAIPATTAAALDAAMVDTESRNPFGFSLEKKGLRLPNQDERQLQKKIEFRQERADFEHECAQRLLTFEAREHDLTARENDLAIKSASLLELLDSIAELRRHLVAPASPSALE